MQSTFNKSRTRILYWLFNTCLPLYSKYFKPKRKAWNLSRKQLLIFSEDSFGYHLGVFLKRDKFHLMPKLENHDCFHVLTGFKTEVKDEIALQYLCFGNGERNLSALLVMLVGTILLPEHISYYKKSFNKGKKMHPFYHLNFKNLLDKDIQTIKTILK
jgi:hypothetical protein